MFPSGGWRGFWEQEGYGRQPMEAFELHFRDGDVTGLGADVVGRFTFDGAYDGRTGEVKMVKQYVDKHAVYYDGRPDGEGSILGTWKVSTSFLGFDFRTAGPFRLYPALPKPTGDEPIFEIGK